MLKRIRVILATIVFALITLVFLDFTGTIHVWFSWLAKIQFLPAVLALNVIVVAVLVILTLLLGRIYCSVICPLGIMQDIIARLNRKKNRYSYSGEKRVLRYAVLVVFVVLLVVGLGAFAALLAPYSSYGRIAENLLRPVYLFGNNILASIAEHFNSYAFYHADVWIKSLPTFIIAAVSFVVIGYLAWRGGRTYCNTICPVGTVLSFFARFSLFKIYFDEDKCRKCSKCSKNCKASCIDYKNMTVDYSRCVTCGNCLEQCSFDALHFGMRAKKKVERGERNEERNEERTGKQGVDEGKRAFLLGAALATTGAAIAQVKKKTDGGLAVIEDKEAPNRTTPITPPGSYSAKNMAQHCTACQLCVSECPNEVLRPSTDLMTLMQPTMSYERGYCRPECNRCSEVCPTGAIEPIKKEDKTSIQIGHAVWVKHQCIPVMTDADKDQETVECGNCARHCPTGAILMVPLREDDEESPMVPTVNAAKCIGCGACENLCPARPFPAIYVEGHEMHRVL
ncbi:MAG: 4Fe-4S binding protein [Prevotella sp.]|nr:4Fe-4S binding protein [Prevotella sp.]